jgi:PPIC-type PPIASE domain
VDRWLTRVLALAVIGLVVTLGVKSMPARPPVVVIAEDAGSDARATASAGGSEGSSDAAAVATATTPEGGLLLSDLKDMGDLGDAGPSTLPSGAPRNVHLGVVLVSYAGAQGAPATARAKTDAHELASRLAADAKTDFHGAVQRGDNGSSDDIGRVPRGVLEAPIELAVFTLAAGAVSDVIETPRGFWIVKRID